MGKDDPRNGKGPRKGAPNAGRPPDAWRELCRSLASREAHLKTVEKILRDPKHPFWFHAWRFVVEQGYGRASSTVDLTTAGKPLPTTIIVLNGQEIAL